MKNSKLNFLMNCNSNLDSQSYDLNNLFLTFELNSFLHEKRSFKKNSAYYNTIIVSKIIIPIFSYYFVRSNVNFK